MMNEESQEENAKDDDNMRFHRGGILLEMLAEVASQTLSDSINALRSYDTNECPNENVSSTQTISPNVSQSVKKKRRRGCKASPAFSHQVDICSLSPQRLLRLFSRLDCNELKRTFTYTCTLQPETCFISFTSFGSEAKARKQMTLHLQEHTTWLSQQTLVLHESPDASTLELGGTQEVEDTPIQVESTISIEEIKNDGPDDSSISNVLFDHSYSNVQEVIPIEVWPIDQSQMNRFMLDETVKSVENEKHKILPLVGREEVITSENQSGHTLRDMLVQSKNKTVQESVPVPEIKTYDKNSLKRKPKGKAKFIGQSNSDKVLALSMIEQIKQKQLSPIDSLECRICSPPRTFTAPTTLLSHYRSHAGIKPFECSICRAAFTRQHSLNYHLLIHSNETRFTCKECGRKFRHPSHFREHQRRHTGEAPYECQRCSARFKTRNTFKRHLKTRHNEELGAGTEDRDSPPPRSPQNDLSPEPSSAARLSGKARKSAKRKISESTSRTPEPVKETSAAKVQKRRLGTPEVEPKALYINPPVKLSPNDNNEYPGQASMSLNHFAEIAKAILTQTKANYDEDDEDNNNTRDVSEGSPIVDTVITFQCAPALAEAIANSDQKKSIVMMV